MGAKTGQARCLVEAADREWEMELPVPAPLSTLAPILQIRNVSAGFANKPISEDQPPQATTSETNLPSTERTNSPPKSTVVVTATSKKVKVLGSNKQVKKADVISEETQLPNDITKILDSITLDLEQNSKIAIVGKNGCGKR